MPRRQAWGTRTYAKLGRNAWAATIKYGLTFSDVVLASTSASVRYLAAAKHFVFIFVPASSSRRPTWASPSHTGKNIMRRIFGVG